MALKSLIWRHVRQGTSRLFSTTPKLVPFVWGEGSKGKLGVGDESARYTPTEVKSLSDKNIVFVSAGHDHSAFVSESGDVYTCGDGSSYQLGHGSADKVLLPQKVNDLPPVSRVACGQYHTLAVTKDGQVYSWGTGHSLRIGSGWLGLGHNKDATKPEKIEALNGVKIVQVAAGQAHSLFLSADGQVFACGLGNHGRLGTGSSRTEMAPVLLDVFASQNLKVRSISVSHNSSFAITDGAAWSWGKNDHGQLGLGAGLAVDIVSSESTPSKIEFENQKIVSIAGGASHTLAATTDGKLYGWGDRLYMTPHQLDVKNRKIVQVVAGSHVSAALDDKRVLFVWGKAKSYCLGIENSANETTPLPLEFFLRRRVHFVTANHRHMIALAPQ